MRPTDAVIDYLEAERARGVSHVYLDEAARAGLRAVLMRAAPPAMAIKAGASAPTAGKSRLSSAGPGDLRPAVQVGAAAATAAAAAVVVTAVGVSKAERLASLRQQAESWGAARVLGTLRETMVFGVGNPDARIVLVGEAPGYEEEKKREPFVGPAGQKLDGILKAMNLTREDVYLTLIVKFRTATDRQATNNRKPTREEIAACLPVIAAEVGIVRPACIVALGRTVAEGLLGLTGEVANIRGPWYAFDGIPTCVTYPPSYLLQTSANLAVRRQVWEDMLMVMEEVGMTITPKQRAFFLPKT
ncbi:MAG: hypothetical protein RLZZ282_1274 [Verrucomicrobiota bacterium]|jgi:DNA polymerase